MDLVDDLAIDGDARGRVDFEIGGVLRHDSGSEPFCGLLYQYSNTLDIGQGMRLKSWKIQPNGIWLGRCVDIEVDDDSPLPFKAHITCLFILPVRTIAHINT